MAKKPKLLSELFHDTLKDVYFAENRILKTLPKMAKAAHSKDLKAAFVKHEKETRGQVKRLEQVFKIFGKKPQAKKCEAIMTKNPSGVVRAQWRTLRWGDEWWRGRRSDDPAIGAQHLAVDPATVRSGEERHRVGDILGLAEPLQRREPCEVVDHLLRLAVEEQLCCGRPRCDGVDRDVSAAQLFRHDMPSSIVPDTDIPTLAGSFSVAA